MENRILEEKLVLLTSYETKFTKAVEAAYKENNELFPNKIGSSFIDYHSNIAPKSLERASMKTQNKKIPQSNLKDKEAVLDDAITELYSSLFEREIIKNEHKTWQKWFADAFKTRKNYIEHMEGISIAYVNLNPKGPVGEKVYQKLGKIIDGIAQSLAKEIFGDSDDKPKPDQKIESISSRYDIGYHFFKDDGTGKGLKSTGKKGRINEGLTDKKQNTYLGRKLREGSVFSDIHPIIATDTSVSKDHFFFTETKKGFEINDVSGNGIAGWDYKKEPYNIRRPKGAKRETIPQLLVGIEYNGPRFSIPVNLGGNNQDRYQVKLIFTPKKQSK